MISRSGAVVNEMTNAEFSIRLLRSLEDLDRVEDLQRDVWGFRPIDVVPRRLMRVMERNGSLVLGAVDPDGALIGFAFGYLGVRDGVLQLCSHMLGILDGWRDRGVGHALKLAQRTWCEERGYDRMAWTFDPLESRNARFNLHKLGCSAGTYWRDLYGSQGVGLHSGSATDRLVVDWRFDAPSPDRDGITAPAVNAARRTSAGHPDCADPDLALDADRVRILIPRDAQALKAADAGLVQRWRAVTRAAFEHYFDRGYRAVDYDRPAGDGLADYGAYVLEREGDDA